MAGIWLGSWESARDFKGIICGDISEFESHMPSHAVGSPSVVIQWRHRLALMGGKASGDGGQPWNTMQESTCLGMVEHLRCGRAGSDCEGGEGRIGAQDRCDPASHVGRWLNLPVD